MVNAQKAETPEFERLKARQREEREAWPQPFSLRVHRATSWLKRAEMEANDNAAAFLFYWIAFNSAYGGERDEMSERYAFSSFFEHLGRLDAGARLYSMTWQRFTGPIRLFLENRYVFAPFWRHHHGHPASEDWEERFSAAKRRFHKALAEKDTVTILSMLFDRLYVLRNQLIHGGATWDSRVNRDQIRDGAAILEAMLPVMLDLMMDAPEEDWGTPMYPVVEQ